MNKSTINNGDVSRINMAYRQAPYKTSEEREFMKRLPPQDFDNSDHHSRVIDQ